MPISLSGSLNLSGSLTTTGTITATTLVVQTITSSISSITGSTNFGSLSSDTHKFTGSLNVTGSLYVPTGSVGIGTASPTKALEIISNTSQDGIKISGTSNPRLTIIDTTNNVQFDALTTDTEAVLRTDTNHPLHFSTNSTLRLTIAASGAATFSSSVTAGGAITTSTSVANVALDITNTDTVNGFGAFIQGGGTAANRYSLRVKNGAGTTVFDVLATGAATLSSTLDVSTNATFNATTLRLGNDSNSGYNSIAFQGNSADGNNKIFAGSSTNDGVYIAAKTGQGIRFWVNGSTQALFINSSQAAFFSSGIAIGNATATTGGIQFPATAVAIADGNNLDDYEEGTFTPTIIGSSTAGTATYGAANGLYTKIGRAVTYNLYIDWSSGTGTGNLRVDGLPFTSVNINVYPASAIGETGGVTLGANGIMTARVNPNSTQIFISQYPAGGGSASSVTYDSAGYLVLAGTYYV